MQVLRFLPQAIEMLDDIAAAEKLPSASLLSSLLGDGSRVVSPGMADDGLTELQGVWREINDHLAVHELLQLQGDVTEAAAAGAGGLVPAGGMRSADACGGNLPIAGLVAASAAFITITAEVKHASTASGISLSQKTGRPTEDTTNLLYLHFIHKFCVD